MWEAYWIAFQNLLSGNHQLSEESFVFHPELKALQEFALQLVPIQPSITDDSFLLIPGHKLSPEGIPSPLLIERLQLALSVLERDSAITVICTGGQPQNGTTEAKVMGNWLESKGISSSRILLEEQSKNTIQNALCSVALLPYRVKTLITVSTDNHIHRFSTLVQRATQHAGIETKVYPLSPTLAQDKYLERPDNNELVSIALDLYRLGGRPAFSCGPLNMD